jgi:flagellar biosynthesis/type III secretory pathway chaperone
MPDTAVINGILETCGRLKTTLEEEFIALSEKNLEHLESVQVRKVDLLAALEQRWTAASTNENSNDIDLRDPLWDEARSLVNECKEAHIRNDLLLKRQLEVVRTVLNSLTQRSTESQSDLYDKMGRIRRKR